LKVGNISLFICLPCSDFSCVLQVFVLVLHFCCTEFIHTVLVEKKKMDIFADSPSPPRDNKGKLTESEAATVMAAKWKMQIGSVPSR
jgi:hypothetical protein